jgi:multidrug efflux pump subunit AcrA (membrane-fusion protein)
MPATVQVLAADAVRFPATVTAISPTAASQGSNVNYEVVVKLQSSGQASMEQQLGDRDPPLKLRDGFTVTVKILIQEKKDIITVPNRAIIRNNSGTSVQVMIDGKPEGRVVTLGFTNGLSTEVIKGLSEGEVVVIQQTRTATNSVTPQISPRGDIHFH